MRLDLRDQIFLLSTNKDFFLSLLEQNFKNEVNEGVQVNADIFLKTVGVLLARDQPRF
jgi:hypothetical protein